MTNDYTNISLDEYVVLNTDSYRAACDHLGMTANMLGDDASRNGVQDTLDMMNDQTAEPGESITLLPADAIRDAADLLEFLYEESDEYHSTEQQMKELATLFRQSIGEHPCID